MREWARTVESRFLSWSRDAEYISSTKKYSFSKLQRLVYQTAHLSGDCLVIITINKKGYPVIKLVDGFYVSQPLEAATGERKIVQGVELDGDGQEIAYWVEKPGGGHKRGRMVFLGYCR